MEGTLARINIDDDLYQQQGWFDLLIATKSADAALGALVRAWSVAQKYWVPDRPKGMPIEEWLTTCKKGIPLDEWKKQRLNDEIIKAGMAEVKDGCVIVGGSEPQFDWLFSKHENGGKGGRPKNPEDAGGNPPKPTGFENGGAETGGLPGANPPKPSSSSSSSVSLDNKNTGDPKSKLSTYPQKRDRFHGLASRYAIAIWGQVSAKDWLHEAAAKEALFDEFPDDGEFIWSFVQKLGVWSTLRQEYRSEKLHMTTCCAQWRDAMAEGLRARAKPAASASITPASGQQNASN